MNVIESHEHILNDRLYVRCPAWSPFPNPIACEFGLVIHAAFDVVETGPNTEPPIAVTVHNGSTTAFGIILVPVTGSYPVFTTMLFVLPQGIFEFDKVTQIQVSQLAQVSRTMIQYEPATKPVKHGFNENKVVAVAVHVVPILYFKHGLIVAVVLVIQIEPLFVPKHGSTFTGAKLNVVPVIHFTIVFVQPLQSVTLMV